MYFHLMLLNPIKDYDNFQQKWASLLGTVSPPPHTQLEFPANIICEYLEVLANWQNNLLMMVA
jgi:hypothetical protein